MPKKPIDISALDIKRLPATTRYLYDPQFHYLVDMLHATIREGQYTPTELREAVILAATQYERHSGRAYFQTDREIELLSGDGGNKIEL